MFLCAFEVLDLNKYRHFPKDELVKYMTGKGFTQGESLFAAENPVTGPAPAGLCRCKKRKVWVFLFGQGTNCRVFFPGKTGPTLSLLMMVLHISAK